MRSRLVINESNIAKFTEILRTIGEEVSRQVYRSLKEQSIESLSKIYHEGEDDTIYQLDREVEKLILPMLEGHARELGGIVLVAEGIGESGKGVVLPQGYPPEEAAYRLMMDPIDGTRGIMYDKRSAFFLAGVAPNHPSNSLRDIEAAVMVELPTSRHAVYDMLWAIKGQGAHRQTCHIESGRNWENVLQPSKSADLYGGFAQISRFFPPGREILAAVEEEMIRLLFPDAPEGKAIVFEDQYISSGGQLYELMVGHDRFTADIRTVLFELLRSKGHKTGHVCHPYDLCTILIAEEAGVIITDIYGEPLDAPFNTSTSVDWVGYANQTLRGQIEPVLQQVLRRRKLVG